MRRLGKRIKGLVERPPTEIVLRLCVVLVAPRVDLVAAGGEQRRGEELCSGAQQAHGEVDRRGRSEAQLACGRLVGVLPPGCRLCARDVFRMRFRDDRGVSGSVDFLSPQCFRFEILPAFRNRKITYYENINSPLL
jgi:hypothetical protein